MNPLNIGEKIKLIHEHVGGEYNKLKDSYAGLTRAGTDALNETEIGIFSDCFLLHARNLIDFLSGSRGLCSKCSHCQKHLKKIKNDQKDDVLALDFVKIEKPVIAKENLMPKIKGKDGEDINLYVRLNKQLSHIAKSRKDNIDFFDERELYKEIFKNINNALYKYNKEVTDARLKIEPVWNQKSI